MSYRPWPTRVFVKYASAGVMRRCSVSGIEQESLYACSVRCISDAELRKRQFEKSLFVVQASSTSNSSPAMTQVIGGSL